MESILKLSGISKQFPGVKALDKVNLDVCKGEVHAVVGENGAGKTTLMMIISGAYQKDEGEIMFAGQEIEISDIHHARNLGITSVFQELSLFPNRTVVENIFAGRELRQNSIFINSRRMKEEANNLLKMFDINFDLDSQLNKLSAAEQQIVEIAKALSSKAQVIIFDEPTASLTDRETKKLFDIITELKAEGMAIIYVSHRLEEVFQIADRITVLRDGHFISTLHSRQTSMEEVIKLMVGRELKEMYPKKSSEMGKEIFEVKDLNKANLVKNINFKLRRGEILGIYGLVGSGRTEMAECIFGVSNKDKGEIYLNGENVVIDSPIAAIRNGIAYLPEDKKEAGLFLLLTVSANVIAANLKDVERFGFINSNDVKEIVSTYIRKLNIKTSGLEEKVINLSGGNQQKVLLAKWLAANPKVLIVDEPTKGIDVGAKAEIHFLLRKLAEQGVGVIMISSELPEVLGMSDRILVMHEGEIKGEFKSNEATQEKLLMSAYQDEHGRVNSKHGHN